MLGRAFSEPALEPFVPTGELEVRHPINRQVYRVRRVSVLTEADRLVRELVSISNEPRIYDMVFRELLEGEPYTEAHACRLLHWATHGERNGTCAVYFAFSEDDECSASISVRFEAGGTGEIGYWGRASHPGIVASVLAAVLEELTAVGLRRARACVYRDNVGSIRVLEKNRFECCGPRLSEHGLDRLLSFERYLGG